MKFKIALAAVLVLVLSLWGAHPAAAGGASCTASPGAGEPGTVFAFECSGFSPNTYMNVYVVEPDGRALSAGVMTGYHSNVGSYVYADGSVRTDLAGNASFWWASEGGAAYGFSHQIGTYTWVATQPGPAGSVLAQGQVTIELTSVQAPQAGASLWVASQDGYSFTFSGSGFTPLENVNIWTSVPATCSGRNNADPASAVEPRIQGGFEGLAGPNTVRASLAGYIDFTIDFKEVACLGEYGVTARALTSGAGGIVWIKLSGNAVTTSTGATLWVSPDILPANAPYLTIYASGFPADTNVNCWTTRPDGRAFRVGLADSAHVDASGNFSLAVHASDFDSFVPYATEEPGVWFATCREGLSGTTAIATFTLYALESDP